MENRTKSIRLHHLEHLRTALIQSPEKQAEKSLKFFLGVRQAQSYPEDMYPRRGLYYQDVIGVLEPASTDYTTAENLFYSSVVQALRTMISYSNNEIIQLISTGKDSICHTCIIGNHCSVELGINDDYLIARQLKNLMGNKITLYNRKRIAIAKFGDIKDTLIALDELDVSNIFA